MLFKGNIFEYDNYRNYLRDVYLNSKRANKDFSFRYFSKAAGLKSPNVLKRVIEADYNLTQDSISKFAKGLKLNKEEKVFFEKLVLYNQAAKFDEKQALAKELVRFRNYQKLHPLAETQRHYFSQWYFVPVRELVGLKNFVEDPKWIAQQILPPITEAEAQKALEELLTLNLIERDATGRLVQTSTNVVTPDGIMSSFKASFLTDMMVKAKESIDLIPRDLRDLSSATVALSTETLQKAKDVIQKFREDIIDLSTDADSADSIYQFNIQLFPLARIESKGGKQE